MLPFARLFAATTVAQLFVVVVVVIVGADGCPAPAHSGEGEGEGAVGEGEGAVGEGEGAVGEGEGAVGEGEGAVGEGEGEGVEPLSHDIGACTVFPAYDGDRDDSWWNADVSDTTAFPTDANSDAYMAEIGSGVHLHPDFGSDPTFGIPFDAVDGDTPLVDTTFDVPDESDPGPYPIPANAPVESGSDAHVLIIDRDRCVLYELGNAAYDASTNSWHGFSGAVFDLTRAAPLRPDDFTSADAAGLPIFPGLARVEEVEAGSIDHALRFTLDNTQRAFVHPATHFASSDTDADVPPMGARLRLKASACPGYLDQAPPQSAVIITALCRYGLILADNGSDMFVSGATDPRWDDDDLEYLKGIVSDDFEVVDTGPLVTN